jgi:septal ring factor EnvC (AmiA/AmiB activator)
VESRLGELDRSQRSAGTRLEDLRQREQALERLMGLLATRDRPPADDDIRRYRGALSWPAPGRVVRGFGRHYLSRYATYTVCNGLRLSVASGTPVQSVFPGVVAYAQFFKGYGNMVVVDHGHGVYSLVAGLATLHVRLDHRVAMGTRLGQASPPSEDGNLYFEIRVGETPQDPRRWLQLEDR